MSFIGRLLRRDKSEAPDATTATAEAPPCPHTTLTAKWDSVQDMGNEEKATSWVCSSCNDEFTPDEAAGLRASVADRLRHD